MNQKMLNFIVDKTSYPKWARNKDATTLRRFWNLLRTDLQICPVAQIYSYLSENKRLNDMDDLKGFGKNLADEFFHTQANLEENRECLIEICLEQDAARALNWAQDSNRKKAIQEALNLQKI